MVCIGQSPAMEPVSYNISKRRPRGKCHGSVPLQVTVIFWDPLDKKGVMYSNYNPGTSRRVQSVHRLVCKPAGRSSNGVMNSNYNPLLILVVYRTFVSFLKEKREMLYTRTVGENKYETSKSC
jgi:hypothetical protein